MHFGTYVPLMTIGDTELRTCIYSTLMSNCHNSAPQLLMIFTSRTF